MFLPPIRHRQIIAAISNLLEATPVKAFFLTFCIVFAFVELSAQTNVWQPSPGHTQIPIWPGTPPDVHLQHLKSPEFVKNEVTQTGQPLVWVCNVSQPTMT